MESLVPILVYIALGLVGLGLLVMLLFGIKSLAAGKVPIIKLALVGIPIVLAGALALAYEDPAEGVIIALLITFVLALGALLLSGVRGLFS